MKLNAGKITVFSCGDSDIDEFVNHHYNLHRGRWQAKIRHQAFQLAAYDSVSHDDILSFSVEPVEMDPDELAKFLESNGEDTSIFADEIFNDLCYRGVMQAGKYHMWIA